MLFGTLKVSNSLPPNYEAVLYNFNLLHMFSEIMGKATRDGTGGQREE